MRKQSKWTIAIASALIGISVCATSVQAADVNGNVTTSQSSETTSATYNKADYFSRKPQIIRVKHTTTAYKDAGLTNSARKVKSGEHFLVKGLVKP